MASFDMVRRSGTPAQLNASLGASMSWRDPAEATSPWRSPPRAGDQDGLRQGWDLSSVGDSSADLRPRSALPGAARAGEHGILSVRGAGAAWFSDDLRRPRSAGSFGGGGGAWAASQMGHELEKRNYQNGLHGATLGRRRAPGGRRKAGSGRPASASGTLRKHFDQHFDQPLVRAQLLTADKLPKPAPSARATTAYGMDFRPRGGDRRGRSSGPGSAARSEASMPTTQTMASTPPPPPPQSVTTSGLQTKVAVSAAPEFVVDALRPPLAETVVDELIQLWGMKEVGFGGGCDDGKIALRSALTGGEPENQQTVYVARTADGRLAGTAVLLASDDVQPHGSLGEVATHPKFRRRGIAEALCTCACDDFREAGGGMLVLGTGNVAAARRYYKIGFRRVPGANVWNFNVDSTDDRSPEEWQVDHFRAHSHVDGVHIRAGTAAERLRMLALLHTPHDSPVLDANLRLHSIRAAVQHSVNGLYPRYASLADPRFANAEGQGSAHDTGLRGCWWAMYSGETNVTDRILVGLASAAYNSATVASEPVRVVCVDGFTHARWFDNHWKEMMATAVEWARASDFQVCRARVAVSDQAKLTAFESLGFQRQVQKQEQRVVYGGDGGDGGAGYFGPALGEALIVLELRLG